VTTLKKKKIEELKDRESRQFFYEEHIETGLPIQIRELRKKRKLTQMKLAELMECDQSNISDWENPNYEYTPQISTLKRLANAFDVPLIVRFGSWEELLVWDNDLSPKKVAPDSFDEVVERLEESATPKRIESSHTGEANIEIVEVYRPKSKRIKSKIYSKEDVSSIQPSLFPLAVDNTQDSIDDSENILNAEYLEESQTDEKTNPLDSYLGIVRSLYSTGKNVNKKRSFYG
jgi:transcriptional regulator with XRE-family HTH domain